MKRVYETWVPYCGAGPVPSEWLSHWNFDPVLIAGIIVLLALGRVAGSGNLTKQVTTACVAAILFISPLCALGSALFAYRVAHHLVLALVLAPMLVAALKPAFERQSLSLRAATGLQIVVFWIWHVPPAYEIAMRNDAMFWLMQLSITASAAAWWIAIRRTNAIAAAASLLSTMVAMGLLGALIVFAGRPLYAPHWGTAGAWGVTPVEDQQIAGLLMWVAAGGVYLVLAAVLLYRALQPPATTRVA